MTTTSADGNKKDYRGFVFVVHQNHGLLLLHCTRKKNKPPHWQLPGGHVDQDEFDAAAEQTSDPNQKLLLAAKAGAARELYEETGMDVLRQLDRLQPAPLQHEEEARLPNLYKSRLFFFLSVTDDDFPQGNGVPPMGDLGKHLKLRLSVEHSGFTFQPEPAVAAEMLKLHSGGKCSEALLMAQQHGDGGGETSSGMEGSSRDVLLPPPPKKDSMWCCFGSSPSQN